MAVAQLPPLLSLAGGAPLPPPLVSLPSPLGGHGSPNSGGHSRMMSESQEGVDSGGESSDDPSALDREHYQWDQRYSSMGSPKSPNATSKSASDLPKVEGVAEATTKMSRTISITFGEKLSKWKEGERKETKRNKKGSPLAVDASSSPRNDKAHHTPNTTRSPVDSPTEKKLSKTQRSDSMGNLFETASAALARSGEHQYRPRSSTVSPETMGPLAVAAANEAADEEARAAAAAKAEALRVEERRLTELIRRKWAPDSISPACLADIVLVQARVRRWCARRLRKRLLVANEFSVTEKNYVQILGLVVNIFLKPLSQQKGLLDPKHTSGIFSDVELLYMHHQRLYSCLQKRIKDWELFAKRGIGDIILNETDFLKLYSTYVNNYPTAMQTLHQLQAENPQFAQFLHRCEEKPECSYQDLHSLLIQPIQRIPRYEMLLLDLLRKTSKSDKGYDVLEQAVEKIKDAAEFINEGKREHENMDLLLRLEKQLSGRRDLKLATPGRRFIREGKVEMRIGRTNQERVLLLFNDMFIVAKKQKEEKKREERRRADSRQSRLPPSLGPQGLGSDSSTYVIKETEPLAQCKTVAPINDGGKPALAITTVKKKYQMAVESDKIRSMWLEALLDAVTQWHTAEALGKQVWTGPSTPSGQRRRKDTATSTPL